MHKNNFQTKIYILQSFSNVLVLYGVGTDALNPQCGLPGRPSASYLPVGKVIFPCFSVIPNKMIHHNLLKVWDARSWIFVNACDN